MTQVYSRKINGRTRYFRYNAEDAKRLGATLVKGAAKQAVADSTAAKTAK